MAVKNANVTARVEQDVKDQAEKILNSLGVSVSSFINMAYRQVMKACLPMSYLTVLWRNLDEKLSSQDNAAGKRTNFGVCLIYSK